MTLLLFLKLVIALAGVILIVGMIKPKWICFWMKDPNRIAVTSISLILFMGAWTGIAKLTMKPKERSDAQHRSVDDQNELQLDNR